VSSCCFGSCFPPGIEFVIAFLACVTSGLIAVPIFPPDLSKGGLDIPRFCNMKEECGASLVLTSQTYL
jgi:acyl-CoA synthetase (AMP-forming)/AMP-acid ligase II